MAHLGPRSRSVTCSPECKRKRGSAAWKRWADKNREYLRERDRARNKARPWDDPVWTANLLRRRERNHLWSWDYKLARGCAGTNEGPCAFRATDPRVLEYDHVDGEKAYNVATLITRGSSLERIEAEVAKCVVRCRNCHTIVTQERGEFWPFRHHSSL